MRIQSLLQATLVVAFTSLFCLSPTHRAIAQELQPSNDFLEPFSLSAEDRAEFDAITDQAGQVLSENSYPQQNIWSDSAIYQQVTTPTGDPLFKQKYQLYYKAMSGAEVPENLKQSIRYLNTLGAKAEDQKAALMVLREMAGDGYVLAQFELAEQLRFGNATKRDLFEAQEWYESAALNQGDVSVLAALNAADLAFHGEHSGPDYKRAREMYGLAAKSNDPLGQTWLGYMSLKGLGIESDAALAVNYFKQAAEQQYPAAQYYLAQLHFVGLNPDIGDQKAIQLYAAASRKGFRPATAELYSKALSGEIKAVELDAEQGVFSIYYATNRNTLESATPDDRYYGSGRGEELIFGVAKVSVVITNEDRETKRGFLRRIWKNVVKTVSDFFTEETGKFNTFYVTPLSYTQFLNEIDKNDNDQNTGEQLDALIFVHGFLNTFSDSIERAAQIAYALNFEGPVIVFSWPAQDSPLKHIIAGNEADWSAAYLDEFVSKVASSKRIYLIAHSMGNEVLLKMAFRHVNNPDVKQFFNELILAAPDIDTQTFDQYKNTLNKMSARITLYTSSDDAVLELARNVYGYTRLGDSATGVLIADGVDTIDTGGAGEDLFGHAFSESRLIMEDISLLLNHRLSPEKRRTDPVPRPPAEPRYWRLKAM